MANQRRRGRPRNSATGDGSDNVRYLQATYNYRTDIYDSVVKSSVKPRRRSGNVEMTRRAGFIIVLHSWNLLLTQ